jgi:fructokinase
VIRIGVDFGGTKIEAAALDAAGTYVTRVRRPNPRMYEAAVTVVRDLVLEVEARAASGPTLRVGVGMPGSISPKTGLVRNANSTWLNGKPFDRDLAKALGRQVRVANDANCFALSEAKDGAAAGAKAVFGVIIGTGCGGGLVVDGALVEGVNGVAGEIGHTPLPWTTAAERGARRCWCGQSDCLETWVSGPALAADYGDEASPPLTAEEVVDRAAAGEPDAAAALDRYIDRLGRGLAALVNLIDPDIIVLGGGMSKTQALYSRVPAVVRRFVFSDILETRIVQAAHGDASGVRGAAWLWPDQP